MAPVFLLSLLSSFHLIDFIMFHAEALSPKNLRSMRTNSGDVMDHRDPNVCVRKQKTPPGHTHSDGMPAPGAVSPHGRMDHFPLDPASIIYQYIV